MKSGGNRAASPFFNAFGGRLVVPVGDVARMGEFAGSHRAEWVVLSILIPLGFGVAVFDGLWRLGGMWLAVLAGVPAVFFGLHVLALLLGAWSPKGALLVWSGVLTVWTLALLQWGGITPLAWVAWAWLGFMGLQLVGSVVLGWRKAMGIVGTSGLRVRLGIVVVAHAGMGLIWWFFGLPWGVAAGATICGFWCLGVLSPGNAFFGPVATRVTGRDPLLTIDDGPDPDDTPAILDLLDQHGAKAVFFVIGDKVLRFPELTREIVARGHELGNHTMTHPQSSMWCAGPTRTRREIADCSEAIEEVTGRRPRWFRAPVGHRNFFTHPVAGALGMEVVGWSRRGYDTLPRALDGIVADLCDGLGEGEILLLHEATPMAKDVVKRVLETLPSSSRSGDC